MTTFDVAPVSPGEWPGELAGMSLATRLDGPHLVVFLGGEIDISNAELLPQFVVGACLGCESVRIDIAHVTFLDSSLLRALLICQAEFIQAGVDFKVRNATDQARRIFEMTSLGSLLE